MRTLPGYLSDLRVVPLQRVKLKDWARLLDDVRDPVADSYQSIPLLSETPDNNSVLLKYATAHVTADQDTVHELRPRLFSILLSIPLFQSNSTPLRPTLSCSAPHLTFSRNATSCLPCARAKAACKPFDVDRA